MKDEKKIKDKVVAQFSRSAEQYVISPSHALGNDLNLMVEWLKPRPEWKALDVATGGGHVAKRLAPLVTHVVASDLTETMLLHAKRFIGEAASNVSYVAADAEHLPFGNHSFDLVTCRLAAHHFPNPRKFVSECARVLKPRGRLLLIDNIVPADDALDSFVNRLEFLRDESHVRCLRLEEWKQWLAAAGFSIVKEKIRKKTLDFPVWVRRTAGSAEQIEKVTHYILSAPRDHQQYIGLQLDQAGKIAEIQLDEWMALLEMV